jgi:hypothetical protein
MIGKLGIISSAFAVAIPTAGWAWHADDVLDHSLMFFERACQPQTVEDCASSPAKQVQTHLSRKKS